MIEKFIADQNQRHEIYFKNLETENQNFIVHIVQLTRKVEMTTGTLKRKKLRLSNDNDIVPSFPPLPTDIDT